MNLESYKKETTPEVVDGVLEVMEQNDRNKTETSGVYKNVRKGVLVAVAVFSVLGAGCGKEPNVAEARGSKPAVEQISARRTEARREALIQNQENEKLYARARQLAKEMGIEMGKSFEIKTAGNTVIEINGIIVPESLLTKDEIEHIETAELLSGKKLYNPDIKSNRGLESGNVKNSSGGYERGSDFGIEKNNTHNW